MCDISLSSSDSPKTAIGGSQIRDIKLVNFNVFSKYKNVDDQINQNRISLFNVVQQKGGDFDDDLVNKQFSSGSDGGSGSLENLSDNHEVDTVSNKLLVSDTRKTNARFTMNKIN